MLHCTLVIFKKKGRSWITTNISSSFDLTFIWAEGTRVETNNRSTSHHIFFSHLLWNFFCSLYHKNGYREKKARRRMKASPFQTNKYSARGYDRCLEDDTDSFLIHLRRPLHLPDWLIWVSKSVLINLPKAKLQNNSFDLSIAAAETAFVYSYCGIDVESLHIHFLWVKPDRL